MLAQQVHQRLHRRELEQDLEPLLELEQNLEPLLELE